MPDLLSKHPGIERDAIENEDGTFNVLDVPIMPPVPAGAKYNEEEIGTEWMRKAIEVGRVEEQIGHLGSLSVGHNPDLNMGTAFDADYAGKILPRRIGTTMLEGERVPCLFGDFLFIPPAVLDRMERNELSYRSPEVNDWAKFRVDNVSLLSTRPFFRMAMLKIRGRIPYAGGSVGETYETEPQFASARFTDGPPPSYRFSGGFDMPDHRKKPTSKFEDGEDKKDEEGAEMQDDGGGMNAEVIVKAIEDGSISVSDFDAIIAAIDARRGGAEEEMVEDAEMMEKEDEDIARKPVQMADTKMAAELTALKEFKERQELKERVQERVSSATAKFSDAGISFVSKGAKDDLAHFAATLDNASFNRYVEQLTRDGQRDPAPTFAAATGRATEQDAPEVAKFAAQGPEALVRARKLSAAFDRAQHLGVRSTREGFILANWKSPHI